MGSGCRLNPYRSLNKIKIKKIKTGFDTAALGLVGCRNRPRTGNMGPSKARKRKRQSPCRAGENESQKVG